MDSLVALHVKCIPQMQALRPEQPIIDSNAVPQDQDVAAEKVVCVLLRLDTSLSGLFIQ
jgi:hypothetical protein